MVIDNRAELVLDFKATAPVSSCHHFLTAYHSVAVIYRADSRAAIQVRLDLPDVRLSRDNIFDPTEVRLGMVAVLAESVNRLELV